MPYDTQFKLCINFFNTTIKFSKFGSIKQEVIMRKIRCFIKNGGSFQINSLLAPLCMQDLFFVLPFKAFHDRHHLINNNHHLHLLITF